MRRLYWKIFISFWLASSLIIISTVVVTSIVTSQLSIPVREKIFFNSYANAAVATYESGRSKALKKWLHHISLSKHLNFYLLSSTGEIIGLKKAPPSLEYVQKQFLKQTLPGRIFKYKNLIVSHEILTLSQRTYRLVASLNKPMGHLTHIPWAGAGMTLEITLAILISGLICYFLSHYLTKPLSSLRQTAKSIAYGHLESRVKTNVTQRNDEIAELGHEFDYMAERIELLVLSKARLLQDISHELRSPLARLHVALGLARDRSDESLAPNFDRMEYEIELLNDLIGEILSLAKLQDPNRPLELSVFNLNHSIKTIIQNANFEYANDKNVKAVLHPAKTIYIEADIKLIERAIENIIRNALRYTKENTDVCIYLCEHKDFLSVEISDKGLGVPEEEIATIFSAFYRVDTSREKKTGGYGLGLAIAKQSIELHQGRISAENIKPHGLKVTIELPLALKTLKPKPI